MLATYATNDVIAEAEAEIINFKQLEHMPVARCLQFLWERGLRYGLIYEEAPLKEYLIQEMD